MPIDPATVAKACGRQVQPAEQLCRRELDRFKAILAASPDVIVGCTQEQPLFEETAEDLGLADRARFVNVRETAGWSVEAERAAPKMAALFAAAAEPMPALTLLALESKGVTLIYGRDEVALQVAARLADRLDITVLLHAPGEVAPPRVTGFPVLKGTIRTARGHLGAFELSVDQLAQPSPSSRASLRFGEPRDGATSHCDILLDLTGDPSLFPGDDLRAGYLRADPRVPAQVEALITRAADLVGTFDKPRYIDFTDSLCAHSRSKKTGCTRCLDLCPAGAIQPDGNHVAIDPAICAGCGQCAAACPTGAASYALPTADALMRRLRTLLTTYRSAGGLAPQVLIHDGEHGEALIDAAARFGDGLPATVLPLRVNEITQVGPEVMAAAFAWGAVAVRLLGRAKPKHDPAGLLRTLDLTRALLDGYGYGADGVTLVETDDPDELVRQLRILPRSHPAAAPATFLPIGGKREVLQTAVKELARVAPAPVERLALPAGAPFGTVVVNTEGCTLCLACVSACPADALGDDPDTPTLRFTESLCVQCGLCAATCPEGVIEIAPQIDFAAWSLGARVVKQEEPFCCIRCAKPFGTRAQIAKVTEKLSGMGHWMFSGANQNRLTLLQMCESCRAEATINEGLDPYAATPRPRARTTEDYLRERDSGQDEFQDR